MTGHDNEAPAPDGLRCEHLDEPLGIGERSSALARRPEAAHRGDAPAPCPVLIWDEVDTTVRNTGEIGGPTTVGIRHAGAPPEPRTRHRRQVTVKAGAADHGAPGSVSGPKA